MTEIIIKPIVYGSIAFYLGKKAEEFISHRWCVYVRGVHNEDISYFIKEVTFTLHPSFTDNVRKVSKFPFEVYECGWGEFDIKIMIYFHEESLKPVEIIHSLKLYPTQSHAALSAKKPVISENYEEIIFVNPKKHFLETLNSVKPETKNIIQMNIDEDMNSIYRDKKHTFSIFEDEKKSEYDNKIRVSTVDNQMNDMKMDEKIEENQLSNYEMSMAGNIDKMYQNNMDSLSVVSNSQNNDNEKKQEDKKISAFIPNISQYFTVIDDQPCFKFIEDTIQFVNKEISKVKSAIEENDKEMNLLKKQIKDSLKDR